jgi:aerobic-type carbon monoxide dehydrogenase small subunit (CoxS/CutS family)
MATPLTRRLNLNGRKVTVSTADDTERLLYVLREQCAQRGPKFGCGAAQCGACTVLVDGGISRSCTTPLNTVPEGASVRTLDGLGTEKHPHPMQQAFIDNQAAQCAFCINGMIMGAVGWIESRIAAGNHAVPSRSETADFLSGASAESTYNYICRCGAHTRILDAIHDAAVEMTHGHH